MKIQNLKMKRKKIDMLFIWIGTLIDHTNSIAITVLYFRGKKGGIESVKKLKIDPAELAKGYEDEKSPCFICFVK